MKREKLFLVSFNARYTHTTLAHYYQARLVERFPRYMCTHVEYTINADPVKTVLALAAQTPDVIVFSVYIWNCDIVRRILADLRTLLPGTLFVLGGPEVQYNPDNWPADSTVIQVHGREGAVLQLLKNGFTDTGNPLPKAKNIPLRDVPFAYSSKDLVRLRSRYIYYESSRGCPGRCTYCLSSAADVPLEYRDTETVLTELKRFIDARCMAVKFVDRTFNADRKRARRIWLFLLSHNCSTNFHFEIDASRLEDEDYTLLSAVPAGMFNFEIGIQSTHPETLAAVGRSRDSTPVLHAVRRLKTETAVHVHVDLIAGLPYAGMAEYEKSFNDVISLGADHFQPGFLKVLPGTVIHAQAEQFGICASSSPPYQVYKTSCLLPKEMSQLCDIEQLVENIYNRGILQNISAMLASACGGSFAFFRQLAAFCRREGFDITQKKIEKIAYTLYYFSQRCFQQNRTLFGDAVVYDYLCATKALRIPFDDTQRTVCADTFFTAAQTHGWPFSRKNHAGRMLIFRPLSEQFYRHTGYCSGTVFCFINTGKSGMERYGDYLIIRR